ncbi:MAG: hypothetical protein IT384_16235 [Deltaproteobacteria bacterium]|nr:hypothetical protein [Deltaproteobacteria bacterium]
MGGGSRALPILAVASAFGCRGDASLVLTAPEGTLVVFAATLEDRVVQRGALISGRDPRTPAIEADRLFTWTLLPGELIDPAGVALDGDRLEALVVGEAAGPRATGSCNRCSAPATRAPQLLSPGDSCTIPRFARAQAYRQDGSTMVESPGDLGPALEETRSALRLEVPGECTCLRPEPIDLANFEVETVLPRSQPQQFGTVTRAGSSTVVMFGTGVARAIDLSSGRARDYVDPAPEALLPTSAVPFGDGFLVSSLDRVPGAFGSSRLEVVRLSPSGTGGTLTRETMPYPPNAAGRGARIRFLSAGPSAPAPSVFAFGDDGGTSYGVMMRCVVGAGACVVEPVECHGGLLAASNDVTHVEWNDAYGGFGVAARHVLARGLSDTEWRCLSLPPNLPGSRPEISGPFQLHRLALGPEALLVCGENRPSGLFVAVADRVAPEVLEESHFRLTYTATTTMPRDCGAAWATPDGFRVIFKIGESRSMLSLDRRGAPLRLEPVRQALGFEPTAVKPLDSTELLARDRGLGVYLGAPGGSFRPIVGGRDTDRPDFNVVRAGPDEAWFAGGPPLTIAHVQTATTQVFVDASDRLGSRWLRSAALDSSAPESRLRFLLVTEGADDRRQLVEVTISEGRIAAIEPSRWSVNDPSMIVELSPGEMLIAEGSLRFAVFSDRNPTGRVITPSFDVPETPAVEDPPARPLDSASMTAAAGIAWLTLGGDLIARIAGPSFERYPTEALRVAFGADAECPDDVSFASGSDKLERTSYSRIRAGAGPSTDLVVHTPALDERTMLSQELMGAIPDGDGAAAVDRNGVLYRFGSRIPPRIVLGLHVNRVVTRQGTVWFAGVGGRVVRGRAR